MPGGATGVQYSVQISVSWGSKLALGHGPEHRVQGVRCNAQGARDARGGIETMHLAADGTRAAGNLEAHNQAVMNLSSTLCHVILYH